MKDIFVASSLDFPPDEQTERNIQERMRARLPSLYQNNAQDRLISLLSIVKGETTIGALALTEGFQKDLPYRSRRHFKWAFISDMELEEQYRGQGLAIDACWATLDYMREVMGAAYQPVVYHDTNTVRLLGHLKHDDPEQRSQFVESMQYAAPDLIYPDIILYPVTDRVLAFDDGSLA